MAGFDLSVHSGTSGIFQARESFTGAELAMLTAEIDLCRYLGAGQLVFHLRDGFLSGADKRKLKDVFSRATEAGVTPLYESNSALTAEYAYDVLDSFPQVGYVLDLGHLNNGRGRGVLGCSVDDFIGQVRDRVVYVHANNNSGFRDEHHGLENGSLDWRRVLDRLDLSRIVKIIIEVRGVEMVDRTAAELTAYLESRRPASKTVRLRLIRPFRRARLVVASLSRCTIQPSWDGGGIALSWKVAHSRAIWSTWPGLGYDNCYGAIITMMVH